nr:protein phosphatase 1 regulatory subunit 32 isoform X2 [Danio rerio]|eukprot:XP_009296003.1 protein phosphatase 1 regulatory subunit 32 isoform X2 [Danio rerio]
MVGPLGVIKPSFGTGRPAGRPANISIDHYCTSYRQSYGKELFQPCLGYHHGTGYSANHRPVLYYSSRLDDYDNPQFGFSLLDSFESQSKRHYQRLVQPDGTEPLACSGSRRRESGYLQLQSQPRLRTASCQTEYKGAYIPHSLRVVDASDDRVLIGHIEDSGYTEGANLQLHTFLPKYVNMTSLQHGISQDNRQKTRPNVATLSIGPVGSSGFVLNAPNITRLSQTPADPQHFLTHYQSKFYNKSLTEQQRSDWMRGGIQKHRKSGYSGRDTDRFNLSGY